MTVVELFMVSDNPEEFLLSVTQKLPASLPEILDCLIGFPALTVLKIFAWCPKQ